jgi:hypothetical protein
VILHEHEQQVEGARAELGWPPLDREQAFSRVEIKTADAYPGSRVGR